jgi:hypothetical protein
MSSSLSILSVLKKEKQGEIKPVMLRFILKMEAVQEGESKIFRTDAVKIIKIIHKRV